MGKVVLTFEGNDASAAAALERLQKKLDSLTEANRRLKEQSKQQAAESNSGISSMLGGVQTLVTSYLSVASAVQVATAAYKDYYQQQRDAAATQQKVADSQLSLARNLGVITPAARQAVFKQVEQIALDTGVGQAALNQAAATAVSAKGAFSTDDALAAVRMAARVAPESPAELQALSGALLDTASLTGSADPKQNLGLILATFGQSRVTGLQGVSQHLIPGMIGVKQLGGTTGDAAALLTALTAGMKDATGATASSAAVSLAGQLEKFLPRQDRFTFDSAGRRKLEREGTGLDSTAARIEAIQRDPQLRERFLAGAAFEAKAEPFIRSLLNGGEVARIFAGNRAGFPAATEMAAQAESFATSLAKDPLQRARFFGRRSETRAEAAELGRLGAGTDEAIRGALDNLLRRDLNLNWFERQAAWARVNTSGKDTLGAAEEEVGRQFTDRPQAPRQNTPEGWDEIRRNTAALQEMRDELQRLRAQRQAGAGNINRHEE